MPRPATARVVAAVLLAVVSVSAARDAPAGWDLGQGYDLCGSAALPPTPDAGGPQTRDAAFDPRGSGTLWLASPTTASLRAVTLSGELVREIAYSALAEGASAAAFPAAGLLIYLP